MAGSTDTLGHRTTRFFFRRYKKAREFFSNRKPDVLTRAFFWFRYKLQVITSARKLSRLDKLERTIWKALYFQRFGTEPLYRAETDRPVAVQSADHKWPRGTAFDNSSNRNFNLKLYAFFGFGPDLRVMDLGCSGGGFVKSFLEDGFTAVGLEGSDWSKKLRSGEWDTCPHHLLTCDITSSFNVRDRSDTPMTFHCITAWEVLEHIPADKLPALIDNLVECEEHLFTTRDYVRGHGMGLTDWDPADGEGFHLVLRRAGS